MNKRQLIILENTYHNQVVSFKKILKENKISSRTLYYDIENINFYIKDYGKIIKNKDDLFYVGSSSVVKFFELKKSSIMDEEFIKNKILEKILLNKFTDIRDVAKEYDVSKNTIVNYLYDLKELLKKRAINLEYNKQYFINGNETEIRMLFIRLMYFDNKILDYVDNRIRDINIRANLFLTDYSISFLSKYIKFCELRIKHNYKIEKMENINIIKELEHYNCVRETFSDFGEHEIYFITAYIASLTTLKSESIKELIKNFVNDIIFNFEKIAVVNIDKNSFEKELSRHIQSSYYRIFFNFPSYNPSLQDIQEKYGYLYNMVKEAIKNSKISLFNDIREEELGFITMYFGGQLDSVKSIKNRVVIVCPNGIMVSKIIENQLINYIPTIKIKGTYSIHELDQIDLDFDYIISTVAIPNKDNVIVVKPILTYKNIEKLKEVFLNISNIDDSKYVSELINIIKENATIKNITKLKNDLIYFFKNENYKQKEQKMLKDLLTLDNMKKLPSVKDWKEAIKKASEVLLKKNKIKEAYVEAMINSVEEYGPYIVLEDGFALPHAKKGDCVNELSMSLLALDNPVDLLGKKVKTFVVLATIDDNSHLRALSSLSELLEEEENMEILLSGNLKEIDKLIQKQKN